MKKLFFQLAFMLSFFIVNAQIEQKTPSPFYSNTLFAIILALCFLFIILVYFLYRVKNHLAKVIDKKIQTEKEFAEL